MDLISHHFDDASRDLRESSGIDCQDLVFYRSDLLRDWRVSRIVATGKELVFSRRAGSIGLLRSSVV